MSQEKKGMAALEEWARKVTNGYKGVQIRNMTTSWRNGLAFCALIHRFHPELIDYDSLDANDIVGNCTLAFDIAESKLGIPALLDPDDMLAIEVPDRLSILTYVAQYYNCLRHAKNKSTVSSEGVSHDENHPNGVLPHKVGSKREMNSDDILEATRDRAPKRPVLLSSQNVCTVCGNPVFILERVLFCKKLYHSSCFRCSNCDSTLNPNTADISPDGKLFCLDNDCHRKLQQLNRKNSPVSKILERQNVSTNASHDVTPSVPAVVSSTQGSVPSTNVWAIGKSENVRDFKPSRIHIPPAFLTGYTSSPAVVPAVKAQSHPDSTTFPSIEIQNVRVSSEAVAEESVVDSSEANKVEKEEQLPDDRLNIEVVQNPTATEGDKNRSVSFSAIVEVAKIDSSSSSESQVIEVEEVGSRAAEVEDPEEVILEISDSVQKVESNDSQGSDVVGDRLSVVQEDEVISNAREVESVDNHDVEKQIEENKNIPVIQNIQEVEINNITEEAGIPEKEQPTRAAAENPFEEEEDSKVEEPISPKTKPQNAFEYLKNNLETIGTTVILPEEPDKSPDNNGNAFEIVNTLPILNVEDTEEDKQETVSHNESGVGDSLQSDTKSDTDSVNLSASESKEKDSKCDESDLNEILNGVDNISSSSLVIPAGEGEVKPQVTPRARRSKSPSVPVDSNSLPTPTPTPRKKTSSTSSTNEMWKNKDYYPAELNPFESEDTFTLKPSDILVIKKSSSHERLPPLNPFEEDEDEEEQQKERSPPPQAPKSPAFSVRSNESFSTLRSRKTRRAPLPPSMVQTVSPTKEKRPAPPPPRPISSDHLVSPNTGHGTPEKKLIPASPDLLKGLKNQTNKATAQHYRKKRRAPPPKRHVTALPEAAIKTELADLAVKEKEFERQGITLEGNIRRLMAQEDENLEEQIEEMVIQLWNIVNEKNDILRRQTELDYLRRGHRLEEMQAEVEFQLRMLMDTPPDQRQEGQEDAEQQLLHDLLKIVDERNEVVDWLDFHRQLDREEDMHVSQSLTSFSSVSRSSTPTPTHVVLPVKSEAVIEEAKETISVSNNVKNKEKSKEEGKKKDKFKPFSFFTKKKKNSKSKKRDEDKDNDESLKVAS